MLPATLDEWLAHLEQLHPKSIELGLERVRAVQAELHLEFALPVIIVGGTNGKGSTCAMLESTLLAAGYRVGLYTSPHLIRYNERVRINGRMADDATLCASFAAVEAARGAVALTYFEFGTLAAAWLFQREQLEAVILEVGLGGRLDAVNVFEPDVAIVTTVDLDHQDYLGPTREHIGYEKAGIYRAGKPAICAEPEPPASLCAHAQAIGAEFLCLGQAFHIERDEQSWTYRGPGGVRAGLPHPALRGAHQLANAAATIAALDCVRQRLPVSQAHIRAGLLSARPPARFQVFPGRPQVVIDVAHNAQAARILADNLRALPCAGRTLAVLGMLRDKDVEAVVTSVAGSIDQWIVAGLPGTRGLSGEELAQRLLQSGISAPTVCATVAEAYALACRLAGENDRICVFGSFHTVADVLIARGAKE